jgi:hypothetical protein
MEEWLKTQPKIFCSQAITMNLDHLNNATNMKAINYIEKYGKSKCCVIILSKLTVKLPVSFLFSFVNSILLAERKHHLEQSYELEKKTSLMDMKLLNDSRKERMPMSCSFYIRFQFVPTYAISMLNA